MLRRVLYIVGFVGLLCSGLIAQRVAYGSGAAQTGPLLLSPEQIIVRPDAGCSRHLPLFTPSECTQHRRLVIQSSEPITQVVALAGDLERSDHAAILSASAITAAPVPGLATNQMAAFDLTLDLRDVAAGEYTGALMLKHAAGMTAVPLTVRIRDHWLLPLLTLGIVILVGGGLALYRAVYGEADELRAQLAQLARQRQSSLDLPQAFVRVIDQAIEAAHMALERRRNSVAAASLGAAELYLDRWQTHAQDWVELGRRIDIAQQAAARLPAQLVAGKDNQYRQSLLDRLSQLRDDLPLQESPQAADTVLAAIKSAQQWFIAAHEQLGALAQRQGQIENDLDQYQQDLNGELQKPDDSLPEEERQELLRLQSELATLQADLRALSHLDDLWRQLSDLDSGSVDARQQLQADLDKRKTEIAALATRRVALGSALTARIADVRVAEEVSFSVSAAAELPASAVDRPLSATIVQAGRRARWRRAAYQLATLLITWLLTVSLGMSQIYAANVTFGANPLLDYLTLILWGIGLEGSRESLVAVARQAIVSRSS